MPQHMESVQFSPTSILMVWRGLLVMLHIRWLKLSAITVDGKTQTDFSTSVCENETMVLCIRVQSGVSRYSVSPECRRFELITIAYCT